MSICLWPLRGRVLLGVGTGLGLGITPRRLCSSSRRWRIRRIEGLRVLDDSPVEMCCDDSDLEGIDELLGLANECLSRVEVIGRLNEPKYEESPWKIPKIKSSILKEFF